MLNLKERRGKKKEWFEAQLVIETNGRRHALFFLTLEHHHVVGSSREGASFILKLFSRTSRFESTNQNKRKQAVIKANALPTLFISTLHPLLDLSIPSSFLAILTSQSNRQTSTCGFIQLSILMVTLFRPTKQDVLSKLFFQMRLL